MTFDMTSALFAMFLWLMFGFLSHMINCDLQRMIQHSVAVRHIVGLLTFFFLFTVIDSGNKNVGIGTIFAKTCLVYVLFIFTTKSKWYFAIPVLALLVLDQLLKKWYADQAVAGNASGGGVTSEEEGEQFNKSLQDKADVANRVINIVVVCLISIGMFHYMYLQKLEYKKNFSFTKFFFETNKACKTHYPTYSMK